MGQVLEISFEFFFDPLLPRLSIAYLSFFFFWSFDCSVM